MAGFDILTALAKRTLNTYEVYECIAELPRTSIVSGNWYALSRNASSEQIARLATLTWMCGDRDMNPDEVWDAMSTLIDEL